jgi:hypothetical protein
LLLSLLFLLSLLSLLRAAFVSLPPRLRAAFVSLPPRLRTAFVSLPPRLRAAFVSLPTRLRTAFVSLHTRPPAAFISLLYSLLPVAFASLPSLLPAAFASAPKVIEHVLSPFFLHLLILVRFSFFQLLFLNMTFVIFPKFQSIVCQANILKEFCLKTLELWLLITFQLCAFVDQTIIWTSIDPEVYGISLSYPKVIFAVGSRDLLPNCSTRH